MELFKYILDSSSTPTNIPNGPRHKPPTNNARNDFNTNKTHTFSIDLNQPRSASNNHIIEPVARPNSPIIKIPYSGNSDIRVPNPPDNDRPVRRQQTRRPWSALNCEDYRKTENNHRQRPFIETRESVLRRKYTELQQLLLTHTDTRYDVADNELIRRTRSRIEELRRVNNGCVSNDTLELSTNRPRTRGTFRRRPFSAGCCSWRSCEDVTTRGVQTVTRPRKLSVRQRNASNISENGVLVIDTLEGTEYIENEYIDSAFSTVYDKFRNVPNNNFISEKNNSIRKKLVHTTRHQPNNHQEPNLSTKTKSKRSFINTKTQLSASSNAIIDRPRSTKRASRVHKKAHNNSIGNSRSNSRSSSNSSRSRSSSSSSSNTLSESSTVSRTSSPTSRTVSDSEPTHSSTLNGSHARTPSASPVDSRRGYTDCRINENSHPRLQAWMHAKRKQLSVERKQRAAERRAERRSRREAEKQRAEKFSDSKQVVEQWMRRKEKEARRLLNRKQDRKTLLNTKVEGEGCRTIAASDHNIISTTREESFLDGDKENLRQDATKSSCTSPPSETKSCSEIASSAVKTRFTKKKKNSAKQNEQKQSAEFERNEKNRKSYDDWLKRKRAIKRVENKKKAIEAASMQAGFDSAELELIEEMGKRRSQAIRKKYLRTSEENNDNKTIETNENPFRIESPRKTKPRRVKKTASGKNNTDSAIHLKSTEPTTLQEIKEDKLNENIKSTFNNDEQLPSSKQKEEKTSPVNYTSAPKRATSPAYEKVKHQQPIWDSFSESVWKQVNDQERVDECDSEPFSKNYTPTSKSDDANINIIKPPNSYRDDNLQCDSKTSSFNSSSDSQNESMVSMPTPEPTDLQSELQNSTSESAHVSDSHLNQSSVSLSETSTLADTKITLQASFDSICSDKDTSVSSISSQFSDTTTATEPCVNKSLEIDENLEDLNQQNTKINNTQVFISKDSNHISTNSEMTDQNKNKVSTDDFTVKEDTESSADDSEKTKNLKRSVRFSDDPDKVMSYESEQTVSDSRQNDNFNHRIEVENVNFLSDSISLKTSDEDQTFDATESSLTKGTEETKTDI